MTNINLVIALFTNKHVYEGLNKQSVITFILLAITNH